MRHETPARLKKQPLFTRRRFQFAGALIIGALLPFAVRGTVLPGLFGEPSSVNALMGNSLAIAIAFWMRLSIETYPGIRSAYVILPTSLTGHGIIVVAFLLTRLPYDRLALGGGFILHVLWLYALYFFTQRTIQQRIAIVPFGEVSRLDEIDSMEWQPLTRPRLEDTVARGDALGEMHGRAAFARPPERPSVQLLLGGAGPHDPEQRCLLDVQREVRVLTRVVAVCGLKDGATLLAPLRLDLGRGMRGNDRARRRIGQRCVARGREGDQRLDGLFGGVRGSESHGELVGAVRLERGRPWRSRFRLGEPGRAALERDLGKPVLRDFELGPGIAHLRPQCGGLRHRQAEVAGDDHHADLVEDRVEGGDRFGFLRTIHAVLLHIWPRAACAERDRLMYCVHSTPAYNSNGYSTRTRGVAAVDRHPHLGDVHALDRDRPVARGGEEHPLALEVDRGIEVGQEHVLAPGKPLREAIERGTPGSIILWGPPGTGKTTLVAALVSWLKSVNRKSLLLAPTGRAAKVLGNYSGRPASTIRSSSGGNSTGNTLSR